MLESKKLRALKRYFKKEPSVVLAFLFGSFAKGREMEESDVDVAVYLREKERRKRIKIWLDLQRILQREVNLVLLDEAPATLVASVFYSGISLSIKDKKLYWKLYLSKTAEAEDFLKFLEDFWRIYKTSKSLAPPEKAVLLERIHFIDRELREIEEFKKIKFEEYTASSIKRRNMDRWCETIINAMIDIAKIILASEKRKAPKTY
jgi:predicted nucleotidyltransferase